LLATYGAKFQLWPDTNSEGEHSFTRVDLLWAGSKRIWKCDFKKYCYLPNLLQQSDNKRSDKNIMIYRRIERIKKDIVSPMISQYRPALL